MRNFYRFTFIFFFCLSAKAQVPTATVLSVDPVFCTGRDIWFVARSIPPADSYSWTISRGVVPNNPLDSGIVCNFSLAGTYVMSVTATNTLGSSVTTRTITVNRSAVASFNASLVTSGYPNQLQLTDYSSNSVKNYWTFSDETTKDSTSSYVKYYNLSGSYSVTAIAISKSGCNDTLSYAFRLSDSSSVVVPNVFTPNNDDVNDVFKPQTRGIVTLKTWVYNRYGVLIWNSDKVNGFWEGRTTSGLECPPGVYYVVVEGTGFDGKNYKLKSNLTLMR